jgi:Heterokaryon incompatibility protein (HET)
MREIYKRAINVTVWLGNDLSSGGDEILWDMDKLASFVKKFHDRLRSSRSGDATIDEMFESQQISTFIRDYAKFVYKDEPITEALMECFQKCCEFFKNPWFRRIWVLQEIRVSQRQVVRCNRGHLWDTITVADQFVELISKSPSNIFHLPRHTYHLDAWNEIVYQKDPTPILALIFGTREFGATNPRDKLVALFGIAAETAYLDSLPAELNSAYVKTKIDFFTDFTSWYINLKRSLTVLSAVRHSRPNDISKGPTLDKHPTWVRTTTNGYLLLG